MASTRIAPESDDSVRLKRIIERIWTGNLREAEKLAKDLLADAAERPETAGRAHSRLGEVFSMRGILPRSVKHYRSAIELLQETLLVASCARARRGLAKALLTLETPARAFEEIARARADVERIDDPEKRLRAEFEQLVLEGLAHRSAGEPGRAAEKWRAAESLRPRLTRLSSRARDEAGVLPRGGHDAVALGLFLQLGGLIRLDDPETHAQGLATLQQAVEHFRSFRVAYHHARALETLGRALAPDYPVDGIDSVSAAAAIYTEIRADFLASRAEEWLVGERERLERLEAGQDDDRDDTHIDPFDPLLQELFGFLLAGAHSRRAAARAIALAKSSLTVLITGESGTGKEVLARLIHAASGRTGKFVAVNLAAIPDTLVEAELFGHVKGAFTGATTSAKGAFREADGGTIFLDEIGDMPLHLQVKILRVLQERTVRPVGGADEVPVNFRVIAATHRDIGREAEKGDTFRYDLYQRLNRATIELAPLRERREEIAPLAQRLAAKKAAEHGKPRGHVGFAALEALAQYSWPGNVRELENVIENLIVLSQGGTITAEAVRRALADRLSEPEETASLADVLLNQPSGWKLPEGLSLDEAIDAVKERLIRRALAESGGTLTGAANRLKVHSSNISRWAKARGVQLRDE